jgi:ABC-type transport system involved in multi-copper enzyme maturation permease subunit
MSIMGMFNINKSWLLLSLLFLLCIAPASAYIDPGTASTIIGGGIWPAILIAVASISAFLTKHFWNPIKSKFHRLKERLNAKKAVND